MGTVSSTGIDDEPPRLELLQAWRRITSVCGRNDEAAWRALTEHARHLAKSRKPPTRHEDDAASNLLVSLFRHATTGTLPELEAVGAVKRYLASGFKNALLSVLRKRKLEALESTLVDDEEPGATQSIEIPTEARPLLVDEQWAQQGQREGRAEFAQGYWGRAVALTHSLAAGVIETRLPKHRADGMSTWSEFKAVYMEGRNLDEVVAKAEGVAALDSDLRTARSPEAKAF